jgi:hypothetical protein
MICKASPAGLALTTEATKRWPNRSKATDGWCGDPSHQSRDSDHNPRTSGVATGYACAVDCTHDPYRRANMDRMTRRIVRRRDTRVTYIIRAKKMYRSYRTESHHPPIWQPQDYYGLNAHLSHMHLSHKDESFRDTRPWFKMLGWYIRNAPDLIGYPGSPLYFKDRNRDVRTLKRRLKRMGYRVSILDGHFGKGCDRAVRDVQRKHGLKVDGIVGPTTWGAIF